MLLIGKKLQTKNIKLEEIGKKLRKKKKSGQNLFWFSLTKTTQNYYQSKWETSKRATTTEFH